MIIQPRILKGFRDSLPSDEIFRKKTIKTLEKNFESYGFVPIDTPVLEYTEVLLGKGGGETDKQVYSFVDKGKREVSMRFDLTVPFARFMGAHVNELYLPFKRYHISKVWRGENTQKGRYREFYQCDFDIVGTDSENADAEILLMMYSSFSALDITRVVFHINNRGLFNSLLEKLGLSDNFLEILRIVDKLSKIGREQTAGLLNEICGNDKTETILEFITCQGDFSESIKKVEDILGGANEITERMKRLFATLSAVIPVKSLKFNPSIARGLDYYTGIVYETLLEDDPGIGSVCSGGRYDNLASLYTKTPLPGVGASIGLDRLIAALSSDEVQKRAGNTDVIVFNMDMKYAASYFKLADMLRSRGHSVEVMLENKKIGQQFSYAEKKGIQFAVICGEDEFKSNKYSLKNLETRESMNMINLDDLLNYLDAK